MAWVVRHIDRIMIVSGILTFTMVYALVAPQASTQSMFGEALEGPVADVVVRTWGALIALVGAMLIYAARRPDVRPLALTIAAASKALFVALVFSHGSLFLRHQAGVAAVVDSLMVVLFVSYLRVSHRSGTA